MKCDIENCHKEAYTQGLCFIHYPAGPTKTEQTLKQQIADLRAENRRLREELGI